MGSPGSRIPAVIIGEFLGDVADLKISHIEENGVIIKRTPNSGFSTYDKTIVLWYQEGNKLIRYKAWRKDSVKIRIQQDR